MTPDFIISGDTTQFQWGPMGSMYPSSLWTATFYINGATSIVVTATKNNDDSFTITVPARQTGQLTAGTYSYAVRMVRDSDDFTVTVETGTVSVKANPAVAPQKAILAERMIALVEKCLEGQLSSGEAIESISIGGRSLSLMSRDELLKERAYWYRELERYTKAKGGSGIKQIILNPSRL